MLVYGDHWRTVRPPERLAELARTLRGSDPADHGERLTGALLAAGELAQGLADAEMERQGLDDLTPVQRAAMSLCTAIARRLFRGGADAQAELAALARQPLPSAIRCKIAEGYAFYAVLPQAYAAAAASHPWVGRPLALGLRTIGTSLAAVVAAVTDGEAISLRPRGHPFARRIEASDALKDRLRDHPGPFAVVDEGPGLSGSSFGAVADLLESLGVAPDRMVFMPSHPGLPGPEASECHRALWLGAVRAHRTLDDILAAEPIAGWFADRIGPAHRVEDLGGGRWRDDLPSARWPPAAPAQERRKFRLTTPNGVFLARFAGLGAVGEEKLEAARALAQAGYTPEPLGLRRGFLLERWRPGAPLQPDQASRRALADILPQYLAFRAQALPAPSAGASPDVLCRMAAHNTAELCGETAGRRVGRQVETAFDRAEGLRPAWIDGRLHPWEWRVGSDGRLCKTDAIDHAEAHDLVGPQDIAWDVAGAAVEYGLSTAAARRLARRVAHGCGRRVDDHAVTAFAACYAAFQGGLWWFAERQSDPAEAVRIRRHLQRYTDHLRLAAEGARHGPQPASTGAPG